MKTYNERMEAVQQKLQRKKSRHIAIMATAGVLCICLLVGLLVPYFQKPDELAQYADNDYYKVIQAINRSFPKSNWYDMLWVEEDALLSDEDLFYEPGASLSGSASNSSNSSVEITDHQVQGVLEGDLIKRSETHIFYLDDTAVEIYEINGEDSRRVNIVNVSLNTVYSDSEMFLSADASRLTVILSGYDDILREGKKESYVQVISLDVSDPMNVTKDVSFFLTGSKQACRMVDGQLMLITRFCMDYEVDFEDPATFLPQYGYPGNMQCIPADNIVIPEELNNRYYTVVTLLDNNDLALVDTGAFMSYSAEIYVSADNIYASRSYTDYTQVNDSLTESKAMTEISCMGYSEAGLETKGTFKVEGSLNNQYSMDEHEGVFRVVTSTNHWGVGLMESSASSSASRLRSANLYCFKVGTWEQLALVESFAPNGETVESVRFDGDYAYVCTAVVVTLTDPVFFFDLTDLDNITVKDTGVIDGYSSSLIQLKDGFLMGIGFDENWNMKVEVYTESADGVMPVCEYIYVGSFATEYKAYFIDRENNLFGIPTSDGYLLLMFDGYELREIAMGHATGDLNNTRGVVIDQFLYVVSPSAFLDVVKLG